jgi:D-alanyl-lipoteichoic acid acyltransferase DltB (MBOAT superfamily)
VIFNSFPFLIFFVVFLCAYWSLKGRARLWLCGLASYFFYGWLNWQLLWLILFSTVVDFVAGKSISGSESTTTRKSWLIVSIVCNLGILGFFKYCNFFAQSIQSVATQIGWELDWATLNIVLPVGISFYTFQSMSYTIDIYRRKISAEPDFVRFATFVSFFPQLVAGPIVRAGEFLPQLQSDREYSWNDTVEGFGQILLGFFKKLVIADSLAILVDQMYQQPEGYSSLNIAIVATLFAFQVYGDFSGYSDIAIGTARMLGFVLPKNFNFPFFATSNSDFWRRWHISLSTWLKDYLYIPLGGSRGGRWMTNRNLFLTLALAGLWHGAHWNLAIWGMLYGLAMVLEREFLRKFPFELKSGFLGFCIRWTLPVYAIGFLVLSLIIFRSESLGQAMLVFGRLFSLEDLSPSSLHNRIPLLKGMGMVMLLVFGEFVCQFVSLKSIFAKVPALRFIAYAVLLWAIAIFGTFAGNAFLYFQF